MAVNGIEIEVGQVWRTRGGQLANVVDNDLHPLWPWDIRIVDDRVDTRSVTNDGFEMNKDDKGENDLVELVQAKPHPFADIIKEVFSAGNVDQQGIRESTVLRDGEPVKFHWIDPRKDLSEYEAAARLEASGGGKLERKANYYQVDIVRPVDPESEPYLAECADIIEALNMTFNEGEAFKALWRLAAARQGKTKAGGNPVYDADKVAHYGARTAAQTRAQQEQAK